MADRHPTYSPADPTPPRRPKAKAAERLLVTQLVGDDAYVTRNRQREVARKGDMTRGDVGASLLQKGARPSEVVHTLVGSRDRDIELPPDRKRSITHSRSMRGGKR